MTGWLISLLICLWALPVLALRPEYRTGFDTTENPLSEGGAWTAGPGVTANIQATASGARAVTVSTDSGAVLVNPVIASDQYVKVTLGTSTAGEGGVVLRMTSPTNATGYYLTWTTTSVFFYIATDNGSTLSFAQLGATVSLSMVANDVVEFRVEGSTLTFVRNGVSQTTRTDATLTTGQPGLYIFTSNVANRTFADFETGSLGTRTGPRGYSQHAGGAPYPRSPLIASVTYDFAGLIRLACKDGAGAEGAGANCAGADLWTGTWASDGLIYSPFGDGSGFGGGENDARASEGFARYSSSGAQPVSGTPSSITSRQNINGGVSPLHANTFTGTNCADTDCKASGLLAVPNAGTGHSRLYSWHVPRLLGGLSLYILMWSDDWGETWTFSSSNFTSCSAGSVCFDGASDAISPLEFVQYGQDFAGNDGNVYILAADSWAASPIYLMRVPLANIETMASYQWFTGFSGGSPTWGASGSRQPIFRDSNHLNPSTLPCMSWNAGLQRFFLTTSHGGPGGFGLFEASNPWGNSAEPRWHTISYYPMRGPDWGDFNGTSMNEEGLFYAMPSKWFSSDGKTFWLVWSGTPNPTDSFNAVKVTLTTN